MKKYRVLRKLSDVLYGISTSDGQLLFSLRKLRKEAKCAATGRKLPKGQEHYGPVATNARSRMVRLHKLYVEFQMMPSVEERLVAYFCSPEGIEATEKLLRESNPSARKLK